MKRNRFIYATAALAVIALGLLSRRHPDFLPAALGKEPGDALWALMVFCGFGVLYPKLPATFNALAAFTFSCAIEFFQLYQAPWIESIRDTLPGRLILGRGFLWSDIAAYAFGILVGCVVETGFFKFLARKNSPHRTPPDH